MAGTIISNVFFTKQPLLSYVDLKVVMSCTSNKFCVMSSMTGADFKVKLVDAYLKVYIFKVNPKCIHGL